MKPLWTNEATPNDQPTRKGLVPKDTLGKILVKDLVSGVEFAIGVFRGLTKEDLKNLWDNREKLAWSGCDLRLFWDWGL